MPSKNNKKITAKRQLDFVPPSGAKRPATRASKTAAAPPSSPGKRAKPSSVVVTPEQKKQADQVRGYVPSYIHRELDYERRGEKKVLSKATLQAFALLEEHYDIPTDLEQTRRFGPWSGSSYEERALAAYQAGQLKPKEGANLDICVACGALGHRRTTCPSLI